ncbi:3-keto-disaccharide hydrolase [Flavitalea antarctica]
MKKSAGRVLLSLVFIFVLVSFVKPVQTNPLEGKWDITIVKDGKNFPSWLEVVHSGNSSTVGYFVGISGSSRPVSTIKIEGSKFSFQIPKQWEDGKEDLKLEGNLQGETISGTITMPDTKSYSFTGKRAPALKAKATVQYDAPITLFNGKDLSGWQQLGTKKQWVAADGVLKSPESGSNIRSEKTFTDFKLHIEFRYPKGSNSGVYLRGRYEVQVSDNAGSEPTRGDYSAVYGFIVPSEMAAKPAGEWQYFDITLNGRMINVVANGKTVICNQTIPGITGGALDSNEGEPGPIMIQGDHGPVEYRNIVITPAKP